MKDKKFYCPDCLEQVSVSESRRWQGKGMEKKGGRLCNLCADIQECAYNRYYQGDRIEAKLDALLTVEEMVL